MMIVYYIFQITFTKQQTAEVNTSTHPLEIRKVSEAVRERLRIMDRESAAEAKNKDKDVDDATTDTVETSDSTSTSGSESRQHTPAPMPKFQYNRVSGIT